ncbi:hypothetical protein [Streptomyces sp. A012304]|uniref:hypothetical protein n=1 Tax=Streptomyces sp. A012304 TaxID=375446 RepID=UPI002230FAE4|nr:hypothetical protein [Streptomyces sp. A012304]GKQ34884.1 hypothetical protein ALMP_14330 [Streptomyces sp. A012304]
MPAPPDAVYGRVQREVARRADALWGIASAPHADPEYAFAERRAAAPLTEELRRAGFAVRQDVAGAPTAFTARSGERPPAVPLLLEYDAEEGGGGKVLEVEAALAGAWG